MTDIDRSHRLKDPLGADAGAGSGTSGAPTRRSRWGLITLPVVAAAVVAALAFGVQSAVSNRRSTAPTTLDLSDGVWHEAAQSPLSPRRGATAVVDGDTMFVFGGTDEPACPPTANCVPDERGFRDGAAYDAGRNSWTALSQAPVPITRASAVAFAGTIYVVTDGPDSPHLLAYSIAADAWTQLPVLPTYTDGLVAASGRLVAYPHSPTSDDDRDYEYDFGTKQWKPVPRDPLGTAEDRTMAITDDGSLVVVGAVRADPADLGAYAPWAAAVLKPGATRWQSYPPSGMVDSTPGWHLVGRLLVNPTTQIVSTATGTAPAGGILDLSRGTWRPLPPPSADEGGLGLAAMGDGRIVDSRRVFDARSSTWTSLPAGPAGLADGSAAAAIVGGRLITFGGFGIDDTQPVPPLSDRTWVVSLGD